MRILFVLHQYLPRHGTGTEQYARALATEFRAAGHEVTIFAFEPDDRYAPPGVLQFERDELVEDIPVRRLFLHRDLLPNRELADYENPLAHELFDRWLAGQQFDLVHVFHCRQLGSAALTTPRRRGLPVAVHLMDFWFLCPNFLLLRRSGELCDGPPDGGLGCIPCMAPDLEPMLSGDLRAVLRLLAHDAPTTAECAATPVQRAHALVARQRRLFALLERAELVIAPSRFLRDKFEAAGLRHKIEVLPYGLSGERFGGATRRAAEGELRIGYVGSITEHKGVHVLIEAVRRLPGRALQLHVHGDADRMPEVAARLRGLAAGDARIRFHGPFAPQQLGDVLGSLDVIAAPSLWYENTPFSVLEALHFGLPVVASALGGMAEIVQHERNGLLFPAGDAVALAAALQRLDDDRGLLAGLGAGMQVPSVADNVRDLLALYEPLGAGGGAR